jgi:integrase
MVESSPFQKLDVKREPENNARDRYLTKEEIRRLLPKCAEHLRPVVEVALHAGLRQGEVLGLKWKDVDFKRERLYIEKPGDNLTKPGGFVDMNTDLVALMKALRPKDRIPAPEEYVFTLKGKKIQSVGKAFGNALKRAKIEGAPFHILRHTCASHMAMAGCTPQEIAAQLRHKDIRTSMRYMHLSPTHTKRAANTLTGLTTDESDQQPKAVGHN